MAESIDLADMASVAGCERFRFARAFKQTVGVSPYRYVVRKRIERARTLIAAGRHSLAEIAVMSGFSDQSHLHQWIKRTCGVTPGQLLPIRRRKNIQDTAIPHA
jgi:AraC family transcriptional regulator